MIDSVKNAFKRVRLTQPMVHSITNNITINDCANIILAAGGTAIMAQDEREVWEITKHSDALVLNMGALRAQEAMVIAAQTAHALEHPVVLDPVAAGASGLRREMCRRLLSDGLVSVIRGNASEIRALTGENEHMQGVEVCAMDRVTDQNLLTSSEWVSAFSRQTKTVIMLTGAIDLITDGKRTAVLRGGSEMMSRITGAGCMLSALTGVCCGANPQNLFEAAVTAAGIMKICGELAHARVCKEMEGTASFRTRLIDAVSLLTVDDLVSKLRIEIL